MLKNKSRITIKKHFLISFVFIALMFTAFAINVEDACAVDVNESMDDAGIELDVEDKLENSRDDKLMLSSVEGSGEVLRANTHILNGGTFSNIQTVVDNAVSGDTIILNDYFYSQGPDDGIEIYNKNVTITTLDGAVLDGKGQSKIFTVYSPCTIKDLKMQNGVLFRGGAIYIKANGVVIDNCEFVNNHATTAGGAIGAYYNESYSQDVIVKNCRFTDNDAIEAAGALGLYGNNSKVINCTFISNSAHNNLNRACYGGAIQMGMDSSNSVAYVINCTFKHNSAYSENGKHTHGGAGCIREGIVYEGCLFVDNSADEGGALTYHSSGVIRNCTFINNTANEYGGALSTGIIPNSNMNLQISDCIFNGNEAPLGGAIQLMGRNIELKDSNLNDNHATVNGGAINIVADTVRIDNCKLIGNIAEVDGGAVYIKGKNTYIQSSSFRNNSAIPDYDRYDEGLGGAIYVNSTNANIANNQFYYNTARNGSAIYYDKDGQQLILKNNVLFENQAWVYALPIYAEDIYYGEVEHISSVIHGGNNIAKYNNLAVSNAIYNAADYTKIKVDNQYPVNGATNSGRLYQDDREYNMAIVLTVKSEGGQTVYNRVLNSNYLGEVSAALSNLQPGKYYVTARHTEDTYYKAITNITSFVVIPKVDSRILKSTPGETYDYGDLVVWTLNITNNGPNKATGVNVTDVLPTGLIYQSCDYGRYNAETGIIELGDLNVGDSVVINIITKVNRTGTITNLANVTSNEYDINKTNNVDNESIFVNAATDLVVVKSVSNSTPNYADSVVWKITVKNNGPDDATGVKVTDLLPASLIYQSNDRNYNPATGVWDIGNLNAGSQITLNIRCKVNATGTIRNTASVRGNEHDYDMSNNQASSLINVKAASDLEIVKSVRADTVDYKKPVVWILSVTNNGPNAATGVKVTDVLPSGLTYMNHAATKGTYSNGVFTVGDLAVGERVTITIVCRADATGNFTNVASVKGDQYDYNPSNNNASKVVSVNPSCDLEITKTVNVSSIDYKKSVKWTLTVKNNGPDAATGVKVTDVLPSGLTYVSHTTTKGTYSNGVFTVGDLAVGERVTITIVCRADATGNFTNVASVNGDQYDHDPSNNNASKVVSVNPSCDLEITKTVNASSIDYKKSVKWTLTVKNNGPDKATGVKVTDVLPSGLTYVSHTTSKGTYSNGVFSVGDLAVGERVTITIVCRADATGYFTNVAGVKGDQYDYNPSNNNASRRVNVKPSSDLAIVKTVNVSSIDYKKSVKWTLTVTNNGPNAATGVKVTDVLPTGLTYVSHTTTKGTYSNGIFTVGELAVGERVTITIVCRADATGNFTNVASIKGDQYDHNPSNNNASKVVSVNPSCDLEITKTVNASSIDYKKSVKWTLTVKNNGPDKATGVKVTDVLPSGLTYVSHTTTKGTYSNGVFTVGDLDVGERVIITIVCRADATGNFTNVAGVKGDQYDHNPSNNNASKKLVVNPATDLEIVKTVNESNPKFNKSVIWTIKVKNNGPDIAHDVKVIDLLPSSLIYEGNDRNYNPTTGVWNIGTLNAGGQITLNIRCRINATGIIQNNASVSGHEYDYNPSNNNGHAVIDVENASDVSVIKLVNNTSPNYGDLVKWTVIVKNNGPNKATGVYVDEVLPQGLVMKNFTLTKGIFDEGIWSVCCLEKNEQQTLEIICKVTKTGKITNNVEINLVEYDPDVSNNRANASIDVPLSADIEVSKDVNINYPYFDDVVVWTIAVKNNGPDGAHNVVVVDELPDGLVMSGYDATNGVYSNGEWKIDYMANGKTEYLYITCTISKLGDITNHVSASAQEYDWNKSNNNDDSSILVFPVVDISVEKSVNNTAPNYGDTIKWIVTVRNGGPNVANNVTLFDEIPAGLTLIGVNGGNYVNGAFDVGTLAVGDVKEFEMICKVSATGGFTNYATVTSREFDRDLSNNGASEYVYVRPAADLSITKTVSKYNYRVGDLVSYAVNVVNNGPDAAENINVREMLDDSLLLKSFRASYGDFDKQTKEWSMDSLGAGESATLYLDALATTEGVAQNDVSVSSDTYDYDLSNNDDSASVDVAERPDDETNVSDVPEKSQIEKHGEDNNDWGNLPYKMVASGNPLVVLLLSLIFSVVILTRDISKRR